MWRISDAVGLRVEAECYRQISGPRGIAPRTKRPLSCSSEMQAHHWVNFTKVYGTYLIENCLMNPDDDEQDEPRVVTSARRLLEILKLSLSSSLTAATLVNLDEKVSRFARSFSSTMPETQKSLVLHLLLFHVPDTLAYWGPARGYWCFPFERSVRTRRLMCVHSELVRFSAILTHSL